MGELSGPDASGAAPASDEARELCRLADEHIAADRLAMTRLNGVRLRPDA